MKLLMKYICVCVALIFSEGVLAQPSSFQIRKILLKKIWELDIDKISSGLNGDTINLMVESDRIKDPNNNFIYKRNGKIDIIDWSTKKTKPVGTWKLKKRILSLNLNGRILNYKCLKALNSHIQVIVTSNTLISKTDTTIVYIKNISVDQELNEFKLKNGTRLNGLYQVKDDSTYSIGEFINGKKNGDWNTYQNSTLIQSTNYSKSLEVTKRYKNLKLHSILSKNLRTEVQSTVFYSETKIPIGVKVEANGKITMINF